MKKVLFLLIFCISTFLVSAQISVNDIKSDAGVLKVYEQITANNKDTIFVVMFNGIPSNTDITYKGDGTNVNWYKYTDLVSPNRSGTKDIYPDDATGWVLEVDGKRRAIWVIDYKNYLTQLKSITPDPQSLDPCHNINLLISATVPDLIYKTPSDNTYKLARRFALKFNTVQWNLKSSKWDPVPVTDSLTLPLSSYTIPSPLCNTKFTLSGDDFAHAFGIDTISNTSDPYSAAATECHITTVVTSRTRDKNNEDKAPDNKVPEINFSVPIDVQFLSNSSEPIETYYNWSIYKDKQLIITRTDKDQRYTFTDVGTYVVKLKVSTNSNCSYTDSITVNATDADIQVPNVFTPNGDDMNDEFRVAYRSLLEFQCWVYNRWGRQVFYWNDPQKGWNGKISGVDAAEGPYFYIIKATAFWKGTKEKTTRLLKGDINLLRGKKK